uniref:Uncharacterized protein n=1 Tax=Ochrobactrum phage ORM_20 TaxID=2985243 RepID=A0A9N6ZGJ9_9VIRU|nr:hypothetical protein ORM20_00231 [Ochrobactrum phage ORM_20]
MIFTLRKFGIAAAALVAFHISTGTGFEPGFLPIDLLFFATFYVIILAIQAFYLTAKNHYEYARDKAAAEAELLAELEAEENKS